MVQFKEIPQLQLERLLNFQKDVFY